MATNIGYGAFVVELVAGLFLTVSLLYGTEEEKAAKEMKSNASDEAAKELVKVETEIKVVKIEMAAE